MKFGILAPGRMANAMALAVSSIPDIERYAVASRDLGRAENFAKMWEFEKAYGSYEEMVKDPEVEFVYVASPHSHHYEHAKLCLEHGKHVLVEKAFTVNAKQAEELVALSKKNNVLLAEAMWTRYMPNRQMISDVINGGVIGKVTSLTANLGYVISHVERMREPSLAGGALLDIGVYPINFALMAFGDDIKSIDATAVMTEKGVDLMNSITLTYEDGRMAVLHSSMAAVTDRQGVINGDNGFIEVQNINNCEEIRVYNLDRKMVARYEVSEQVNGYEYEVVACIKAIREGKIECEEMPHEETLRVMHILDSIREKWNMKYPCE